MATVTWQPLPDGEYAAQHDGHSFVIKGDWLKVIAADIYGNEAYDAESALLSNIRLCRATTQEAVSVPEDIKMAIWMIITDENAMAHYPISEKKLRAWLDSMEVSDGN